jgi:hypothetical protein
MLLKESCVQERDATGNAARAERRAHNKYQEPDIKNKNQK